MQTTYLILLINFFIFSTVKSQITNGYCASRPNPCLNGGICVSVIGGGFTCTCAAGFIGNLCDVSTGTSSVCTTNTCLNGGTCVATSISTYICRCPAGFIGARCETSQGGTGGTCPVGSNPCRNNAACFVLAGGGFQCVCPAGFQGTLCESSTDITNPPPTTVCQTNRCLNGGMCQAVPGGGYRCICTASFTGFLCDIPIGGVTVTTPTPGSTVCLRNPCANGGTCVTVAGGGYRCMCNAAYTGFLCQYSIFG